MMVRFIVYLFETGLCLSLLYLAYWLFLRKETYFNFNRIFLVGSIVLALAVPLLHLNFSIRQDSSLEYSALGILKFRNYYEELIRMCDADFGSEPGGRHSMAWNDTDAPDMEARGVLPGEGTHGSLPSPPGTPGAMYGGSQAGNRVSPARLIIIIYICGVMYFFARFVYLVSRLCLLVLRNRVIRQDGFRMVEMKEDISPFSFFHFLFINTGSINESELQNVLEHEKSHIRQKHSIDHLFAQGLAVFQWFNPFAWQIRNAMKTTHEYIADRQVVNQGFEMFDYQSLLLKQVIGYHSVELVNNFNLKPIKKRIAMMTKTRSGVPARLKAMLVIPFALIIFLLFADFTLKGPGNSMLDMKAVLAGRSAETELAGLWVKQNKDEFSKLLYFSGDRFTFNGGTDISEYYWKVQKGELILSKQKGAGGIHLKVETKGDELTIWWNDYHSSLYKKSDIDNTMDLFLSRQDMKIDLPVVSQFRLMEKQDLVYKVCLGYNRDGKTALSFNGQRIKLSELPEMVEKERSQHSKLDVRILTAMLFVDSKMPMSKVAEVKEKLREINSLKIADAGYPNDGSILSGSLRGIGLSVSPLLYHTVAIPRLLPPPDAKILKKEAVSKEGIEIFVIDLSARNSIPGDVDKNLEQFIRNNNGKKYVFSLEYGGDIPYGRYIESVDMVFRVVYGFREELAMKEHQVHYAELGTSLRKEIRKAYPMVLSEAWSGK